MMKILILALTLMLVACAADPEVSRPADTAPETLQTSHPETTMPDETLPETTTVTGDKQDENTAAELEEIAERCEQKSIDLLKKRMYQITGEPVSQVVRYGDVKDLPFPEKLIVYAEIADETLLLRVTVPTDMGDIPLVYNAGAMLMIDSPETVDRPVPEIPAEDFSISSQPSAAVTVHGIREFQLSYNERAPQLIRITSRQELEEICPMIVEFSEGNLDYTYEYTGSYDPDRITGWMNLTECYDAAWFETHDLWIAVQSGTSSTPALYAEVNGNALHVSYEHCEIVTDDIIGRQVLIEVNKGDILTWSRTGGRHHTPETYSAQTKQWMIEDCYETCIMRINRDGSYVTQVPEYHWTLFGEIPEEYYSEAFRELEEDLNLTPDAPVLRMDLTANTGTCTAYFTQSGRLIGIRGN